MPLDAVAASAWFVCASEDLRMAQYAATDVPPMASQACFHAQQAAEKALKGLLAAANLDVPRTHDVLQLVGIVRAFAPEVEQFAEDAGVLTRFAVSARYPDASDENADDARWALLAAEALVAWARRLVADAQA